MDEAAVRDYLATVLEGVGVLEIDPSSARSRLSR